MLRLADMMGTWDRWHARSARACRTSRLWGARRV